MKQLTTQGIVLARTDFQEADRIVTMITPDHGKLRLIAKGVRRSKSKLAGGLELFSISDVTYIKGRSEIVTLVSARLDQHFGNIVKDIDRTMLGYDFLKRMNKITEDQPEPAYFDITKQVLAGLDDKQIEAQLVELWFSMQLLKVGGHMPNLRTSTDSELLITNKMYEFDFDTMSFRVRPEGLFGSNHIKLLRLVSSQPVERLKNVQGIDLRVITSNQQLVKQMATLNT